MQDWPLTGIPGRIERDEIHVWAWQMASTEVDLEILDDAEQQRMRRFHFAGDRERYAAAHVNLRRILGGYLNQAPEKLRFRTNPFGKPELAGDDFHFSLSHTRSIALLGVARSLPLGVDVEDIKPIEREVAAAHFSARELSALAPLQGDAWLRGFYRCWTRKEAVLKAEGVGLHRALDSFDVSLLPDAPAALLESRAPLQHAWQLFDLSPAAGTIAALATAYADPKLVYFSLPS